MEQFTFRRVWWSYPFLALLAPGGGTVTVDADGVHARFGLLGSADVPLDLVAHVGRMRWPWWGGLGVRIGRGLVAFAGDTGDAVVVDLVRDVRVKAPFSWRTGRLVLVVDEPARLAAAIAAAGGGTPAAHPA